MGDEPDGAVPEEGYYFNDDLTDHAIAWIRQQKALTPDKPFFAYLAPGATHAPPQMEVYAGYLENTDHHLAMAVQ